MLRRSERRRFSSASDDEVGGLHARLREQLTISAASVGKSRAGGGFRDVRGAIWRRRWRNNAFPFGSSDEDGANPANVAASEASNHQSAMREQLKKRRPPYPGPMNPRVRRLIVSGVLGGLLVIVVVTAAWNWLR